MQRKDSLTVGLNTDDDPADELTFSGSGDTGSLLAGILALLAIDLVFNRGGVTRSLIGQVSQ